jgi:hypothetical protein
MNPAILKVASSLLKRFSFSALFWAYPQDALGCERAASPEYSVAKY